MKLDIPEEEWVFFKSVLGEGCNYIKSLHMKHINLDEHVTLNNICALVWMPEHCPWIKNDGS
jgi:hypothetical protein